MVENYFRNVCAFFVFFLVLNISSQVISQEIDDNLFVDDSSREGQVIADPLELLNRAFFQFNDKLYFWVLKPVAKSYTAVVHKDITIGVVNIFRNVLSPIRIVNNFLQGKFKDSGIELSRFAINTTLGMAGLADPATEVFELKAKKEDFGQTLGTYGVGEGIYICWPLFGPSNIRDTFGLIGDLFLNPMTFLSLSDGNAGFVVQSFKVISDTAQDGESYEDFKESSFDSYTAMRDFYTQSRRSKVDDKNRFILDPLEDIKLNKIDKAELFESEIIGAVYPLLSENNGLNDIAKLTNVPSYFDHGMLDSLLQKSNHTSSENLGFETLL